MGFLNALGTVSRRSRWRRRVAFWDFDASTFHDITDATLSLALFRDDPRRIGHHLVAPDHCGEPAFTLTSDDGERHLLPDGPNHGQLDVPQSIVAGVPPGLYWASFIATYPDGSFLEVLVEMVRFVGPALAPPPLRPFLEADSGVTVDSALTDNGAGVQLGPQGEIYPLTDDTDHTIDNDAVETTGAIGQTEAPVLPAPPFLG